MTTGLRACAGVLLAVWCAGASVVSLAAQAPAQKKPAPAPAKSAPAAPRPAPAKSAPAGPAVQQTPSKTAPPTAAAQQAPVKATPAPANARPAPAKTAPGAGAAQPATTKPASAQAEPQEPPPPEVERLPGAEAFTYKPEGRRDPFLSLVNRAAVSEKRAATKKPEGLRGLLWDEITLRGIFQGRKGAVALVQGPDTKTYQLRVGDQLFDAVIRAITADSLIGLQEVNDPLSLQKQRERRKTLRVAEEVK